MNVAGPSRAPAGRLDRRERVESTYEDDLIGLLQHLNVNEIEELQTYYAQRRRDGHRLSDHDIAMDVLLQHAGELTVFQEDRALAQLLAAGEETATTPTTQQVRWQVAPPQNNNRATVAAATAPAPTRTQPNGQQQNEATRNGSEKSQTWGEWFSSVLGWTTSSSSDNTTNTATAPRAPVSNRPTGHTCVICQDPIHGAEVRAPCNHYYDIACITDLFQAATKDETLYPPRCCRMNIAFADVRPHLSQALLTEFLGKQTEFSTVKRVYCSSPRCSRFLGPACEGIFSTKVYTCPAPACGRRTCGRCREEHSGDRTHVCRPDADAEQVLTLGRASGWARCPGCSQMIELNIGCFHMTCRCRTEFCYLCQARWKTCHCPQWDERRLMAAAEARVDAQLGMGQQRGARRDEPVRWARPAPAPVPAPAPAPLRPRVPVPAEPARRAPEARQPVAALAVPVRPAVPARPVPSRQAVPAATVTPTTRTVQPQPTPARNATATNPSTTPAVQYPVLPQRSAVQAPATGQPGSSSSTARYAPVPTPEVRANVSTRTTTLASSSVTPAWRVRRDTTTPSSTVNTDREVARQRMIRETMDRLRVDHECDHTKWQYRRGSGHCQSCGHNLPFYLFHCQGCEMLVCNRCRRNRL